ncbi:MAG: hypothetical protein ACXABY_29010, partial [Candidatus Thorarchaeota archaeon]
MTLTMIRPPEGKLTDADTEDYSPAKMFGTGDREESTSPDRHSVEYLERLIASPKEDKDDSKHSVKDLERLLSGEKRAEKGIGYSALRSAAKTRDKFLGHAAGAFETVRNLVAAPMAGIHGLGMMGMSMIGKGRPMHEIKQEMESWYNTYELEGDRKESKEEFLHAVEEIFKPAVEAGEAYMAQSQRPVPVVNMEGKVVGQSKPLPALYGAVGGAGIELTGMVAIGEAGAGILGAGMRGAKSMSTKPVRLSPREFVRETPNISGILRDMDRVAKETPLPKSDVVREPHIIDAQSGNSRYIYQQGTPDGSVKLHTGGELGEVGRGLKKIWDEVTQREINASGESSASMEAINRLAQQEDMLFFRTDVRKPKQMEPLIPTTDRVDIFAGDNQVIFAKKIGDPTLIVIDSGKNLTKAQVTQYAEFLRKKSANASLFADAATTMFSNPETAMAGRLLKDMKRKITDSELLQSVHDKFFIEPRFQRIGGEETA